MKKLQPKDRKKERAEALKEVPEKHLECAGVVACLPGMCIACACET